MRVFVTGGTGLVGKRLIGKLTARGETPVLLTRRPDVARAQFGPPCEVVEGDPMKAGDWQKAVADCDAAINLAGENVFNRRWKAWFKQLLVDSRVITTRNVVEALTRQPRRADGSPKVLVNASATGWYGPHGDEELDESSPPADDFLGNLCFEWEKAALAAQVAAIRTVMVRVGVVLAKEGGALAKLLTPFKLFVGGPVAGGRQWMSWIHHEDLTDLFLLGLDRAEAQGPINGTAPHPVTNREFSKALGRALHRPSCLPTPGWALRVMLGEVANVVTTGQRVLPKAALQLRYQFKFPTVDAALANLVS
jgi:uncharacterized protein